MDAKERREKIMELLTSTMDAISGTALAKHLGVSRQVVVQDIALLRATNKNIISTTRGYMLYVSEDKKPKRCFMVKHTTEQMEEELCTIVDHGGRVLDVIVMHDIYGQIQTDLILDSRLEVFEFVKRIQEEKVVPLNALTDGIHLHTVEAESEAILDCIERELDAKNYLITV